VAVFAMSAVVASAALAATNGPYYKVAGKRLGAGETHAVTASAAKTYVLKGTIAGVVVTTKCTALKLNAGAVIVGSAENTAGSSKEILEYSGCTKKSKPKKSRTRSPTRVAPAPASC
jgi:hypothetical protein